MLRNYLTVVFRNLVRNKVYSCVNILGLAVGIAFCILTFLFVRNEWTYDAFHKTADRIYRVVLKEEIRDREYLSAMMPDFMGPALAEEVPEIERFARLRDFAYRLELGPGVFLLGSVLALLMVILTVGFQAVRSATANPVDVLRHE